LLEQNKKQMKKLFLTVAMLSFVGGIMAGEPSKGDDKNKKECKKECKKGDKACCKKGGEKSSETKSEEKK
jgi:hypothetical protein